MDLSDEDRQAMEDQVVMVRFLDSPEGRKILQIMERKLDEFLECLGTKQAPRSPEFYAGAVHSIKTLFMSIYGSVSHGERVRLQADRAQKQEVKSLGNQRRSYDGNPKPVRHRDQNSASREAF